MLRGFALCIQLVVPVYAVWYHNNTSYAESHTHIILVILPSLSLLSSLPVFSTALLFFTPSVCRPHPPTLPSSLSPLPSFLSSPLPPYGAIFFDRSPFVSLPSHSAYWHRWKDLSLSLSLSRSLPLYLCHCSPPLYLSFSLFVSLCLYLYLPPVLPLPLILIPHYLSTHTWFILHITEASIILLWEGKKKSLLFFFFFFFIHFSSVTTFCTLLFCLFLS